ncbi:hypothetical protein PISMIDRAFT_25286 [Pisolithus microcarpus 441]|uniref:Unplaced genomic scaffold scaffold_215, whole genome shotgun sequence n=1 Tax=Pisolithus microcarpus 441 TaxID=765257 RepID=A0A0C9YMS4_9AGAM|nr:hypothetical protein PISMIDRAFT_25286 [Pisolithus microcarpus 441]
MSTDLCPLLVLSNAINVLQLSNNMFATNSANICQMWSTTPIPTTPKVLASVMLVAPQYIGHFSWFLLKLPIINFAHSLQPAHTEHAFPLTWDDQANAVQFFVSNKTFMLSFADSASFWCFKYMVFCCDQVDTTCVHPFNSKMLLDAVIKFRILAQIPLGIGRGIGEGIVQEYYYGGDSGSPDGPKPSSVTSPDTDGSSPTVTYVNRDTSPICRRTPVPVQEGPCPVNTNIQPVADMLPTLSTVGDECYDHNSVVSHKKRKHDST